jgi:hypothetical protein
MTKDRYKEIRNLPNFLHIYFMEESGTSITPQDFNQFFTTWMFAMNGMDPNQGVQKIINFLDTKFAN